MANDSFPHGDFYPVTGVQGAADGCVHAGGSADVYLTEDGCHILVSNGLRLRWLRLCIGRRGGIGQIQIQTGSAGVFGSRILFPAACEQGAHQNQYQDQAQQFADLFHVREIHGVTSLSSHFSSLL